MTLDGLVYWGLTPQQQPGSYQDGEMMMTLNVAEALSIDKVKHTKPNQT